MKWHHSWRCALQVQCAWDSKPEAAPLIEATKPAAAALIDEEVQQQLTALEDRMMHQQQQLVYLTQQKAQFSEALSAQEDAMCATEADLVKIVEEVPHSIGLVSAAAEAEVNELYGKLGEARTVIEELQEELCDVSDLEEQLHHSRVQVDYYQHELSQRQERAERASQAASRDADKLQLQNDELALLVESLVARVKEIEMELPAAEEAKDLLCNELDQSREALSKADKTISDVADEHLMLLDSKKLLERELKDARRKSRVDQAATKQAVVEKEEAEVRVAQLEARAERVAENSGGTAEEVVLLSEQRHELLQENATLDRMISEKDQQIQALEERVTELLKNQPQVCIDAVQCCDCW